MSTQRFLMPRFYLRLAAAVPLCLMLASCGSDTEPDPVPNPGDRDPEKTIVVYAVNKSSLAGDFKDDSREMLEAMRSVDSDECSLLVYYTESDSRCVLSEAVRGEDGNFSFRPLRTYARNTTSTDPERMNTVLMDALSVYPDSEHTLFFWGHGSAWYPHFSGHSVGGVAKSPSSVGEYSAPGIPELHGYGGEYGEGYVTDWIDIDRLAAAVPEGRFKTIWFDCCYMASIELLYEFRDKCDWFVAYPTEVWQYGLPYDRVLPYIMRSETDLIGAARTFFDSYIASGDPVTVSVFDMSEIEGVAVAAQSIIKASNTDPQKKGVVNYSRSSAMPFYDFGQYIKAHADAGGNSGMTAAMTAALGKLVVYHQESEVDFNKRKWVNPDMSGINCHWYSGPDTKQDLYYQNLAWYHRLYD